MSDEQIIDGGGVDWLVKEDVDGCVWITPALRWEDAEVYEWLRDGQALYDILERADKL